MPTTTPSFRLNLPLRTAARIVSAGLAAAAVMLRFLPTTFVPPGSSQDEGWVAGLNMALRLGLNFGRDFIFTYGPFGPVATRLLDPASATVTAAGGAVLGLAMAAGLVCLGWETPLAMLGIALALPLLNALPTLTLTLPLPALLLAAAAVANAGLRQRARLAALALLPALGLLPLIKGNLLAISLIATPTLGWLLWQGGQRRLALALPAGSLAWMVLLWLFAGQQLIGLPRYFLRSGWIISGYNDSMGIAGPLSHGVQVAGLALGLLALMAWGARCLPRLDAAALLAAAAGLSFVAFKAGFVRQDPGTKPSASPPSR